MAAPTKPRDPAYPVSDVPPAVAHAVVLRQLPRALRAALDPSATNGSLPAQLAADADALSPGLGAEVAAWIRAHVGECAGLPRWDQCPASGPSQAPDDPAGGGLAALDAAAAADDDPVLREIADALLMIGAYGYVAPLAGRAAVAAWGYLDRIAETGATLHQFGLASAYAQLREAAIVAPWPDLDADREPAGWPEDASGRIEASEAAWRAAVDEALAVVRKDARMLALGLSVIAGGWPGRSWDQDTLAQAAIFVGRSITEPLTHAAASEGRRYEADRARSEIRELKEQVRGLEAGPEAAPEPDDPAMGSGPPGVVVCPRLAATGAGKGKDITRGYEHVIGRVLPLVTTPDLGAVRAELASEFPHAHAVVDAALGAFAGRPFVHARPLLVVGPPGAGKSRFVRRLGELLGVGVYRVDGANDAGGSFGGTERRWYTSEPCRPFMAVARLGKANPLILVDELDKASTRPDYGRLWDSMLQALDPENARRFPDPSLQAELDLSWVTIVSTANDHARLPGPLLDRMRLLRFPEPGPGHLDALLPGLLAGLAIEAGLDPRFHAPLDGVERSAVARRWRGGSLRRLRGAVEAVLRVRDRALSGRPQ